MLPVQLNEGSYKSNSEYWTPGKGAIERQYIFISSNITADTLNHIATNHIPLNSEYENRDFQSSIESRCFEP